MEGKKTIKSENDLLMMEILFLEERVQEEQSEIKALKQKLKSIEGRPSNSWRYLNLEKSIGSRLD